jgi:hypothetical protein
MFPASSYQTIYLILVSLLTFAICGNYTNSGRRINSRIREGKLLREVVFVLLLSFFIGFRPISSVFVDMVNYADFYDSVSTMVFAFDWRAENIIFDNLLFLFASLGIKKELFFVVISVIYFVCMFFACKRLFRNDAFLVYLVCLAAFSTFSYGVNGIKAGAAASIFLLAIAYHDKIIPSLLIALISYGFHHSMQVLLVAWIIVLIYHDSRVFLVFWVLCVLLAALQVTFFQGVFASLTDDTGSAYLSNTDSSTQAFSLSGFRLDFILYSAIPVFLGAYLILRQKVVSKEYNLLLSLYLLTNSVWLLCMYAEFTNRIAYLSWFMYPVVLIYPFVTFLKGKRPVIPMKLVIYGHLLFTIFMAFIYY